MNSQAARLRRRSAIQRSRHFWHNSKPMQWRSFSRLNSCNAVTTMRIDVISYHLDHLLIDIFATCYAFRSPRIQLLDDLATSVNVSWFVFQGGSRITHLILIQSYAIDDIQYLFQATLAAFGLIYYWNLELHLATFPYHLLCKYQHRASCLLYGNFHKYAQDLLPFVVSMAWSFLNLA